VFKVSAGGLLLDGAWHQSIVLISQKCYASSAEAHYDECRALERTMAKGVPPEEIRLIARICWRRGHGAIDFSGSGTLGHGVTPSVSLLTFQIKDGLPNFARE
jgi:hypothetical protein